MSELSRIDEFIKYLLVKHQDKLLDILGEDATFLSNKTVEEIITEVQDTISDYLSDPGNSNECEDSISHEGGDEWAYEGGIWKTTLYENHNWYFWIEPEGQRYGLYSSMEEALGDAWVL